jgi:hypothetical protein
VTLIIDYADAIRLKLKLAGIHDSSDLMSIFEDRNGVEASAMIKTQLNDVDQKGLKNLLYVFPKKRHTSTLLIPFTIQSDTIR